MIARTSDERKVPGHAWPFMKITRSLTFTFVQNPLERTLAQSAKGGSDNTNFETQLHFPFNAENLKNVSGANVATDRANFK